MATRKPNESQASFAERQKKEHATGVAARKAADAAKVKREKRLAAEADERAASKRYAKQAEKEKQLAAIGTESITRQFNETPGLSPEARELAIEMAEAGDYGTAKRIFDAAKANAEAAGAKASREALSARMGNGGPVQHAIVQRGSRITYGAPVGARDLVH